ncbi:MAG: cytochrome b N-terminal domain-containing protein [Gemmatimonadetes bacterium]|nr:cytochrome b N-terminal domain-containing protein [Gemmatimonadota bacterium]
MKSLLGWLDHRTGYRDLLRKALVESIPGGAKWRYVWGSALTFAIAVQFVTGIILWAAYSPNAQGAWESVYYIENVMAGGWMLRGIHHYMAHATMILLVLHLMQVVVAGAYKAPREVNFWFGIVLLHIVLGLSLTGYLLPWDQKGYWATKVATSIASITPVVGPALQKVLVGGADYGHLTLTRFFALHAGVLPGALIALIAGHVYLFRRHGVTAGQPRETEHATQSEGAEEDGQDGPSAHPPRPRDGWFWPDQALRDAVACLAVMAAVLYLVIRTGGAPLGAPADAAEPYAAARPEWYFMFLFQWLKYFPAGTEVIGAIVIPGLVVTLIALMPFAGRWRLGHRFNLGLTGGVLSGVALLTWLAYAQDRADPDFVFAQTHAEAEAERAVELAGAGGGIPASGALALLRNDPFTQGPRLFAERCASCHTYDGHDGMGRPLPEPQTAAELKRFASREWLEGLLDPERVATPEYFGSTEFARGRMVRMVQSRVAGFTHEEQTDLAKVIKAVSAQAALPYQAEADEADRAEILEGTALISSASVGCTECHEFQDVVERPLGPTLTGFGSEEWLTAFIRDASHPRFYGDRNDRMPAFGPEEILSDEEIRLLVAWLREDWYRSGEEEGGPR